MKLAATVAVVIMLICLAGCTSTSAAEDQPEASLANESAKLASNQEEPPFIDGYYIRVWLGSDPNAGAGALHLWLERSYSVTEQGHSRKGETYYLGNGRAAGPDEEVQLGPLVLPTNPGAELPGYPRRLGFTLSNGRVVNDGDVQIARVQIVGRVNLSGDIQYWVIADQRFSGGRWLRSDARFVNEGPAVSIRTLERWRRVSEGYPPDG